MAMSLLIPLIASILLLILLYIPTFKELFLLWWNDPNYSHGFLIPIIAGYLIWNRTENLKQVNLKPSVWGLLMLLGGLLLLFAGKATEIAGGERGALFLKGLSLIIAFSGILLLLGGKDVLARFIFPLSYLVFMIPLPDALFSMVTIPLQSYATSVTTVALQWCSIPALQEGNLIHLPSLSLGVTEACSGIRSLLTLLAGATVLSHLAVHYWWQHLILIGSVIPITIVTNAFRVTGTGLLAYFFGEQAAQGFFHGFSGWTILIIASFLMCAEILLLVRLPTDFAQETTS
jgi:exosortase